MTHRLNIPLQGQPCGKARHHSQVAADGHRTALESWERTHGRPAINLGELATYWCRGCRAYHVGHRTA